LVRNESFEVLAHKIIEPEHHRKKRALNIIDAGAGNCWLTYNLVKMGHHCLALDINGDSADGLGAIKFYDIPLRAALAEFNHLPVEDNIIDLVIFNGSLHYSESYHDTISSVLQALRSDGRIVIIDSPFYPTPRDGHLMVREREDRFMKLFGFAGNVLHHENFLTMSKLEELIECFSLGMTIHSTSGLMKRMMNTLATRIRSGRKPATFPVISLKIDD